MPYIHTYIFGIPWAFYILSTSVKILWDILEDFFLSFGFERLSAVFPSQVATSPEKKVILEYNTKQKYNMHIVM